MPTMLPPKALAQIAKLSPRAQELAVRELKQSIYRNSLYAFSKYALGYTDICAEAHARPIAALERNSRKKLIVMPRGTFKTSLTSVAFPLWMLLRNPDLRILLDSEVFTNSKLRLREIKQHLSEQPFQSVFGNWVPDGKSNLPWSDGEATVAARRKRTLKEPTFTCSGIGAQKTGNHYDLIIADDLNSLKNTGTVEQAQKVIDHFRMYTSLLEPEGIIVVVGTRYSSADVIHFIMNEECGVKIE